MFVDIETHAMAEAVGEEFVIGAETGGSDLGAGRVVDGAGEFSGASGIEAGILRFADGFEGALHFFGGLAENGGAGDVGLIAFDEAPVIDQYHIAFLKYARLLAAMWQSGRWAEKN